MTNERYVTALSHEQWGIRTKNGPCEPAEILKNSLIDLQELKRLTAQSRSAIYAKGDPKNPYYDPTFPKRIATGPNSVRWKLGEVLDWIESRPRVGRLATTEDA